MTHLNFMRREPNILENRTLLLDYVFSYHLHVVLTKMNFYKSYSFCFILNRPSIQPMQPSNLIKFNKVQIPKMHRQIENCPNGSFAQS